MTMMQPVDPALSLVAVARHAEAAQIAFLSAEGVGPDAADDAIYDALEVVPTTLAGVRAKMEMALEIEGAGWDADVSTLLRSLLASPALTACPT